MQKLTMATSLIVQRPHANTIFSSHALSAAASVVTLEHYGAIAVPLVRMRWTSGRITNLDIRLD